MKIDINGNSVYVDGYLHHNINEFKKRNKKKWDTWLVISGDEGDGKSTFAKQICHIYSDGKFTLDNIAWTPKQFKKIVTNVPHKSTVLYDEAISGLSSRRAMSLINTTLISMAAQCRKRRLFVCVLLPSFHDLDKNIAIHRSRGLIHIYAAKDVRGFFKYFTKESKKILYVKGKKYYDMSCVKETFKGRFTDWTLIDEDEYEKRKDKALEELNEENINTNPSKQLVHRNAMFKWAIDEGWTQKGIAKKLSEDTKMKISRSTIEMALKSYKEYLLELESLDNPAMDHDKGQTIIST